MACGKALAIDPWLKEPSSRRRPFMRQVTRRPNHRGPDIHGKDCVVGSDFIEDFGDVLRMDWALTRLPVARSSRPLRASR